MTKVMRARPVLPNKTYHVIRRCKDRTFFLRPSAEVNQIIRFELARVAEFHGIHLHAFVFMSNHLHLFLTDSRCELPDFMETLIREISKGISARLGHWGGIFEPKSYTRVEEIDPKDVPKTIAYILANPTKAGLVRRAKRWPGVTSVHMRFGDEIVVRRPTKGYYKNSSKVDRAVLRLVPPPGWDALELEVELERRVREAEKAAQRKLAAEGRKFIGEKTILAQNPFDSATSREKRRGRVPTFSASDPWRRIEAAQRKREWYASYQAALAEFIEGVRDVVFPAGTWRMARFFGCRCELHAAPS